MRKNKVITIIGTLFIIGVLIIFPIFGEDILVNINLRALENNIIDNNLELKRLNENVQISKERLQIAKDRKNTAIGDTEVETYRIRNHNVKEAQMNLAYDEWLVKEKLEDLLNKGKEYYWEILLINSEIPTQEGKIKRLNNNLGSVKKKVELGLDTELNLLQQELAYDQEIYYLNSLIKEKTEAVMNLNMIMGIKLNEKILNEEVEIPYKKYILNNLESRMEETFKENGDLIKLSSEIELGEILIDIYKKYGKEDNNQEHIDELIDSNVDKKYDIEKTKIDIEYNIRTLYNTILNLEDSIAIEELNIENYNIELNEAKRRYELGLNTINDVQLLEEKIAFSNLKIKKLKLEHYIMVEKLENIFK